MIVLQLEPYCATEFEYCRAWLVPSVAWHTRSRFAVGIATMLHKIGTAHQTATNCSRKFESIELSENPVSSSWLDAALYDTWHIRIICCSGGGATHDNPGSLQDCGAVRWWFWKNQSERQLSKTQLCDHYWTSIIQLLVVLTKHHGPLSHLQPVELWWGSLPQGKESVNVRHGQNWCDVHTSLRSKMLCPTVMKLGLYSLYVPCLCAYWIHSREELLWCAGDCCIILLDSIVCCVHHSTCSDGLGWCRTSLWCTTAYIKHKGAKLAATCLWSSWRILPLSSTSQ